GWIVLVDRSPKMNAVRFIRTVNRFIQFRPLIENNFKDRFYSTKIASFEEAKAAVNTLKNDPGTEVKLQLYALFKQATLGDCTDDKPSALNFVQKAKWQAWTALKSMSKEEAASKYISIISELVDKEKPNVEPTTTHQAQAPGLESTVSGNGILQICLNRPEKKNAITKEMYECWTELLNDAAVNPDIKVVAVTGKGDYFSSGNDLRATVKPIQDGHSVLEVAKAGRDLLNRFVNAYINFPKPLVGLVNGPAIGISVSTLGLYDYVLASDNATFQTPFVATGQTPEGCSSYTFPRLMGPMMANDMLLFGRKLSATEACSYGLVTRVVPQSEFSEECNKFLNSVVGMPPETLRLSKETIRIRDRETLVTVNALECDRLMERWTSPEFIQAVTAFLQRKK
ncbi:Enoyl-CoA delta isomerase 2, mitochondrial, partial [Clonorchis sinensis]